MSYLETERLILRRWRAEDLDGFAAINADPEVMKFYPACLTREESWKFIVKAEDKFEGNGFGLCVAELKETGEFVGYVGLNVPDFMTSFTPCVEIGWRLGRKHWGRGYASEGAKAVLRDAFKRLKIAEVLAWTYEGNVRSRRVMERIGMKYRPEEDFLHPMLPEGHRLRPHILYEIKSSDFE